MEFKAQKSIFEKLMGDAVPQAPYQRKRSWQRSGDKAPQNFKTVTIFGDTKKAPLAIPDYKYSHYFPLLRLTAYAVPERKLDFL
ncbi:MAG: hypothetical protein NC320_10175, partial [Clostridium sp.]|nr:hypothetical protein [Clostridium sp.]MCM1547803.1 hypothetical protein [Ruminococcus sp.]